VDLLKSSAWIFLVSRPDGPESHPVNPPCPWLPDVSEIHDFALTRRHGRERGAEFYQDALRYAQSQWISGKPAQAILQLDKAWMADLPDGNPALVFHPPPYQALRWMLCQASTGACGYLGNPVRHFQHLASRMSGPRAEIRAWRAWLCFHLAERVLPSAEFPRDGRQLVREGNWIPGFRRSLDSLAKGGWPAEARCAECARSQERPPAMARSGMDEKTKQPLAAAEV
jgi:hypothetical protein